jgi:hypothetical protein
MYEFIRYIKDPTAAAEIPQGNFRIGSNNKNEEEVFYAYSC